MDSERFVCTYWDAKRNTCTFNKKAAMKFLNSVGAVIKDGPRKEYADQSSWKPEDWGRYNRLTMHTLASGNGGLNLPTGKIHCGEGSQGINPSCEQWTYEGRKEYKAKKEEGPNSLILIRR